MSLQKEIEMCTICVCVCGFINVHVVTASHPQGYKVVIPLQVQLTGEDQWFSVNISCPLIKRSREETPSNPTRECKQLILIIQNTESVFAPHVVPCQFGDSRLEPPLLSSVAWRVRHGQSSASGLRPSNHF